MAGKDLPTVLPRWADNPGAGPPTAVTEPTEEAKDAGWQAPDEVGSWNLGKYVRQVGNWLGLKTYEAIAWLTQTTHRTSDLHPDHVLPGGTPPTVGASLAVGTFSARAYVGGYEVPLTTGPEDDFPADYPTDNRDYYWDLGRNATWYSSNVANGAGAPALAANRIRVYVVRATGGATSLLADYTRTMLDALRLRFGWSLLGSVANKLLARLSFPFASGGTAYVHIAELVDNAADGAPTGQCVHLYLDETRRELITVKGARWTSASEWQPEGSSFPATLERRALNTHAKPKLYTAADATPFADSAWLAAMTSGGVVSKVDLNEGSYDAGGNLTNSDYEVGEVRRYLARTATAGGSVPTHVREDQYTGNDYALPLASQGTDSAGPAREWTLNCKRLKETGTKKFARIAAGEAWKLELSVGGGLRIYWHDAGEASPWADTVSGSTWVLVFETNHIGSTFALDTNLRVYQLTAEGNATVDGTLTVNNLASVDRLNVANASGAPLAHLLYRQNILKAWGTFETDGAGGFLTNYAFGATVTMDGDDVNVGFTNDKIEFAPIITVSNHQMYGRFHTKTASGFKIRVTSMTGTQQDLDTTANVLVSFMVPGNDDT